MEREIWEKRHTEKRRMKKKWKSNIRERETKGGNIERGYKQKGDKREMGTWKSKYKEEKYRKERVIQIYGEEINMERI